MKRVCLIVAAAALACLLAVTATAAPPVVRGEAYVVQNATTGEVLAADDAREPLPIASITKLMTALVTLERAQLDDVVTVSPRTATVGESTIHLRPGERITVRDLLGGALIQSANDAANALAEHVAGSIPRFVELMNERFGAVDNVIAQEGDLSDPGLVERLRPYGVDSVICSNVLEHVDDDRAALAELRRVVAPGGWVQLMVPQDLTRDETYEDASITDPDARRDAFLQHDHVRLYGRDFADRIRAAGFDVEVIVMAEALGPAAAARHGLLTVDLIHLCRPVPSVS